MTRLLQTLFLFGMYFCAASTAAQAVGLGALYWHGGLTSDKIRQYATVLYGMDLPPPAPPAEDEPHPEGPAPPSRNQRLAALAEQYPLCTQRQTVLVGERTLIDQSQETLETRQRECELLKKNLDAAVTSLEADAEVAALADLQQTLESLQPAQTKAILLRMLSDKTTSEPEALAEVAGILQAMTSDKLKKTLGEFKSDAERLTLHRILAFIGQLEATPVEGPPP